MQKFDKEKVWHDALASVRVSVSPAIFSTWLTQTHLVSLKKADANRYTAEIGCASTYVKSTVERRYFGLIQDAVIKVIEHPCDLVFSVAQNPVSDKTQLATPLFEQEDEGEELVQKLIKAQIRIGFSFENFAVSASNQMAHAAAEAVSNQPGLAYNPLIIWGGVGVGKTHLMHAVGRRMLASGDKKVLACTGEDFTNDIVEGIRNKTTPAVRGKYRKLDGLFVDDIQFIAGKDAVQDEFFHTFNAVTAAGGQIIMTSDKPPHEIPRLEERLKSRFEAGLIVDIAPPDFELRCAIVQIKAQEKGLALDNPLVQAIAGNIDSARRMEGFLTRLASESKIKGRPITEEMITAMLGKNTGEDRKNRLNPESVIDAISNHYSIGKRALLGKGRSRLMAHPRQILMYILRTELNLPYEEVGRIIGGRDHSTVMHGVEKISQMSAGDVQTREDIMRIRNSL